ncbi:hypothetical protein O6H91_23G045500 [Diphasiastrum complanatum]|uniref:Uncharacterized protein n=1 Tax=Diphasiastrum complanatum TaxID=34168 RepID=A0ACC2AAJ9_DIPCM|nr:hypothetical protein O6H91_23G045500 [Diphasiastrum complanatum]
MTNFCGFMADEAQTNWTAIHTLFNGDPNNEMIGQEQSCLFHLAQSLHIHTTKFVQKDRQIDHKNLCQKCRSRRSRDEALVQCRLIRQWWRKGKIMDSDLPSMDSWMSW